MKPLWNRSRWLLAILLVIFLSACQESSPTPLPTDVPISTLFALPLTWTPTVMVQPTATMPPRPTVTPSPMPPTPTPEWPIPPLDLPLNVTDVLIYTTGRREADVYTVPLDKNGIPLADKNTWWDASFTVDLQLSPDRKHLAVWSATEGGHDAYFFNPLDGSGPSYPKGGRGSSVWQGVPGDTRIYLGWASDNSGILFALDGSIALIGEEDHLLVLNPADYRDTYGADISPDGRYLIYSLGYSASDVQAGTWLLDLETQTTEKLLDHSVNNLVWSPNGQWIAFTDRALMIMRPDGTDFQTVHPGPIKDSFPVWSPNGNALAFMTSGAGNPPDDLYYVYKYNAYIVDVNASGVSNARPVMPGSEYGYIDPSWSPDGNALLVVGKIQDRTDIWLVTRDGEMIQQLTFDGGPKRYPVWFQINNP